MIYTSLIFTQRGDPSWCDGGSDRVVCHKALGSGGCAAVAGELPVQRDAQRGAQPALQNHGRDLQEDQCNGKTVASMCYSSHRCSAIHIHIVWCC